MSEHHSVDELKSEKPWSKMAAPFVVGAVVGAIIGTGIGVLSESKNAESMEARQQAWRRPPRPPRPQPGGREYRIYAEVVNEAIDRYVVKRSMFVEHFKEILNRHGSAEELQLPAQTFVRVRNELREGLTRFASTLGYETDELEQSLDALQRRPREPSSSKRLQTAVLTLTKKWPARAEAIQSSVSQMLVALGVEGVLKRTAPSSE